MSMRLEAKDLIDLFGLRNATVRGDELTCSCPFDENHKRGDSRPSFGISLSKGVFSCLACGESGTLITLAMKRLGLSYFEAHRAIYRDMTMEDAIRLMGGHKEEIGDKDGVVPIQADIDRWSRGDRDYWYGRGFNDETIGKWHLGYDARENRVVVPVYHNRELVGWSKRAVDNVTKPKWRHSKSMKRNRILFGMDNFKEDSCILVEAPLSVIMLDQYGIKNSLASFGASLSDEQAIVLRNNYNKILIFYDPDEAGEKGTMRATKKLSPFMEVFVVQPTRDDPAAMSREECYEAIMRKPVIASWAWKIGRRC